MKSHQQHDLFELVVHAATGTPISEEMAQCPACREVMQTPIFATNVACHKVGIAMGCPPPEEYQALWQAIEAQAEPTDRHAELASHLTCCGKCAATWTEIMNGPSPTKVNVAVSVEMVDRPSITAFRRGGF